MIKASELVSAANIDSFDVHLCTVAHRNDACAFVLQHKTPCRAALLSL